jgi:hypothetical protein
MVNADFAVYHRRATQLADAMKLCHSDITSYASAAGLLAVHSAISYCDVLLISLGGKRSRGKDHRNAVVALRRACSGARLEPHGVPQLQKLLGAKTDIAYGERQVEHEQIEALCAAAERFQAWVERTLQQRQERSSS